MGLLKSKLMLRLTLAVSVFGVAVGGVSTMAWFQINNSANASQGTQTRNIDTTATVHQANTRAYDDSYQTTPTNDKGQTLSYDHSKGGAATSFYIRQYGASETTVQMFDNVKNDVDKAVYFNIKFTNNWKIYDAATNAYYGYAEIDNTCPLKSRTSADGEGNIVITNLTGYYDVYLTGSSKIWLEEHYDVSTSDQMGNQTGYYLYGTSNDSNSAFANNEHADIQHGIPMYVNAAANTTDLGFYTGLRLAAGDVFYVASGDTTTPYTYSDNGSGNLLNNATFFSFDGGDPASHTGRITCNLVGYYSIALKSNGTLWIETWDGFEVDGTHRYEVEDDEGNRLNSVDLSSAKQGVERKAKRNAATTGDKRFNILVHPSSWWKNDNAVIKATYSDAGAVSITKDSDLGQYDSTYTNYSKVNIGGTNYYAVSMVVDVDTFTYGNFFFGRYDSSGTTKHNESGWILSPNNVRTGDSNTIWIDASSNFSQDNNLFKVAKHTGTSLGTHSYQLVEANNYNPGTPAADPGYVFEGWYTDSSFEHPYTTTTLTGDINLYAKYRQKETKTFYLAGGSVAFSDSNKPYLGYNDSGSDPSTWVAGVRIKSGTNFWKFTTTSEVDTHNLKIRINNDGLNWSTNVFTFDYSNDINTFYASPTYGSWTAPADSVHGNGSVHTITYKQKIGGNSATTIVTDYLLNGFSYQFNTSNYPSGSITGYTTPSNYWTTGETGGGTSYKKGAWANGGSGADEYAKLTSDQTLYAYYAPNGYTVKFSGITKSDISATYDQAFSVEKPSKTGYTFAGWTVSITGGSCGPTSSVGTSINSTTTKYGKDYDNFYFKNLRSTAGNVTLTANWTAKQTTVTLDRQGGTTGTTEVTATYNSAMPSATMPTKDGYIFGGYWTGENGTGTKYYNANGSSANVWNITDSTMTLYAEWTAKTSALTFNLNGGSGTAATGLTATYDSAMPTYNQAAPTKTGYTFAGFFDGTGDGAIKYYNSNLSSAGNWDKDTTAGTTLYAKWTANTYTVKFDVNGGTSGTPDDITVEYGSTYGEPVDGEWPSEPTGSGLVFRGWFTEASGGTKVESTTVVGVISSPQTLYAHWGYTITFVTGGEGSGTITTSTTPVVIEAGTTYSTDGNVLTFLSGETATANASGQDAQYTYSFSGWSSNSGTISAPLTITANFNRTGRVYIVTLNTNGGTINAGDVTEYRYGVGATLPTNVTKTGYTFNGWYGNSGCTGDQILSISSTATGPKEYWAKWTAISYTISYDYDGGTAGSNHPGSGTYDQNVIISNPSRTGYTFDGWISSAGDGLQGNAKTGASTPNSDWDGSATTNTYFKNLRNVAGEVTLTATWTANTFTIAFAGNGTNPGTSGSTTSVVSVSYDSADGVVKLTANGFSREGNTFNGWNTAANGSGTAFADKASLTRSQVNALFLLVVDGTTTLYAQWNVKTYSITYRDQGDVDYSGDTVIADSYKTYTYNYSSSPKTLPTVEKVGYTFNGWFTLSGCTGVAVTQVPAASHDNLTYYAKWTINTYTVTYLNKGGSAYDGSTINVSYKSYTYNPDSSPLTLPNSVTKTGYTFGGWFVASGCTGVAVTQVPAGSHENLTYYVLWNAKTTTISFDQNGGTAGKTGTVTATYNSAMPTITPKDGPTKTGYTFQGYFDAASGGTKYYNADWSSARTWNKEDSTKTLYAQWVADTFTIAFNANTGSGSMDSVTATYGSSLVLPSNTTITKTGYGFSGWATSSSGAVVHENAATIDAETIISYYGEVGVGKGGTKSLYAIWGELRYNYFIYGVVNGNTNWETTGSLINGSTPQYQIVSTATQAADTVTWSNVYLKANDRWRIYRPAGHPGDGGNISIWWGLGDSTFLTPTDWASQYSAHDYRCVDMNNTYSGTYNITLVKETGIVTLTLLSLDLSEFNAYQYYGNNPAGYLHSTNPNTGSGSTVTWNTDVVFHAGYNWHLEGPIDPENSNYNIVWGINTGDNTNIKATEHWDYYFEDGGSQKGRISQVHNLYNLYDMTATSITLDVLQHTIVISGITISSNQFYIVSESGESVGPVSQSNNTVSFNNITLATDDPWWIRIGAVFDGRLNYHCYKYGAIASDVTMLGQSTVKNVYLYEADGDRNIGTGYGGTYTVSFSTNTNNHTGFISVSCSALALSDFVAVRRDPKYGQLGVHESTVEMSNVTNDLVNHTATYTGTVHLYIGDRLYFKNDNSGSDSSSRSCVHNYFFNDDIVGGGTLPETFLIYKPSEGADAAFVIARVDVTLTYTFVFLATSANTTKANVTIGEPTENTRISFNHAEDAGIYLEIADNSSFTNSRRTMMHTTNNNDYWAQEAPVEVSSGTYMRIVKTHSNNSAQVVDETHSISSLTEYYYVGTGSSHYANFVPTTYAISTTGNGDGQYITISTGGRWTISLAKTGEVVIEAYSGTSTISSEHEVPYYLIGVGMPGSDLRKSDFTIYKGIQLWTYGGNSTSIPCYVGQSPNKNNTSPSYIGSGVNLKKGDVFAITSSSAMVTTFAAYGGSDVTINSPSAGKVTVNKSGKYNIYINNSNQIVIALAQAASDWSRSGTVIATARANNTLSIGGNLDFSLLDAYLLGGYSFEIELSHVSTGAAGDITYTISNTSGYSINVNKKDAAYGSGSYAGAGVNIANNGSNNTLTTNISGEGTTTVCLRVIITPEAILNMITSGTYSFSMNITYSFVETL